MGRAKATPAVSVQPDVVLTPDELRAYDGRGNVRPADDRFLTEEQIEVKDAYVEEATPDEVRVAQQITDAVATTDSRPEATPVTSPRGDDKTPEENA